MHRRTLLNLLLIAAAVLLTALLWLDREAAPEPEPLTKLSRDAITEVRIDYPDALDLHLVRGAGGWRMTAPIAARLEDSEVMQILRLAEADVHRKYPGGELDPARIGLDEPPYTVTFATDDGRRARIELGGQSALEGNRYARVGDTVHLIAEPNMRALDAEYSNLIARDLLAEDAEIEKLELPGATLTPTGNGGWTVSPESADRGADAAQRTLRAWHAARAMWLKPADDREAVSRVRIHLAGGGVRELAVVARKPQLILRDPALGVHYHVAANEAGPLLDMDHGHDKDKNNNHGGTEAQSQE